MYDCFTGCPQGGVRHESGAGDSIAGAHRTRADAHPEDTPGPFGENLRDALGQRLEELGLCQSGRKTYRLGQSHHQ